MDNILGKSYDASEAEARKKAARWREKWLSGIKLGENYDVEAHEKAANWAIRWEREAVRYSLDGAPVEPQCTELVLEALQLTRAAPFCHSKFTG